MPQRFAKPGKGPIAPEYIQDPETLTGNFHGRREALQKCGHAHFSIVPALLCRIVGQAAATRFLILEFPRGDIHFRNMPPGVATPLAAQEIIQFGITMAQVVEILLKAIAVQV
jgi:hypothetical protein